MSHFLIGFAIGGAIAACIAVPLVAPWSFRVRYLATAQAFDPWHGLDLGLTPRLDMRAVKLVSVEAKHGGVELAVEDLDGDRASRRTLARTSCPPHAVAELDGWMALRTPLLLMVDGELVHVYGPESAVTNLSFVKERVR
jgi:hypothetical protein